MRFEERDTRELVRAIAEAVIAHAPELTELDCAIGDADHGLNLERGFRAVLARLDEIGALPLGAALDEVGRTLILSVGGASGPLFGKLFCTLGRQLPDPAQLDQERLVAAGARAIGVVQALGRAEAGHKTMLDVLVPTLDALRWAADPPGARQIAECARQAARETIPMLAQRGRAAYLGERSRGHMDPGARSCQIMVEAACTYLETRARVAAE